MKIVRGLIVYHTKIYTTSKMREREKPTRQFYFLSLIALIKEILKSNIIVIIYFLIS